MSSLVMKEDSGRFKKGDILKVSEGYNILRLYRILV